jgi:hypothetical protein
MSGYIGLENFCSIVESLAPWTEKTPVEKRATRADYEDALAEAVISWGFPWGDGTWDKKMAHDLGTNNVLVW